MLIGLHPDDVDAPAFVPVHLREPEEQPVEAADDDAPVTAAIAEQPSQAEETSDVACRTRGAVCET